jgi:hypothetical protein
MVLLGMPILSFPLLQHISYMTQNSLEDEWTLGCVEQLPGSIPGCADLHLHYNDHEVTNCKVHHFGLRLSSLLQ